MSATHHPEVFDQAAIAAMREPTDLVATAGRDAMCSEGAHDCEVSVRDIWPAMIDEALK